MDGDKPNNGDGSWQYTSEGVPPSAAVTEPVMGMPPQQEVQYSQAQPLPQPDDITWTASEFVAHHKTSGWYGMLTVGAVVASAIVWLVTKDVVSSVVIVLAALAFGFYGSRQPRELQYRLDSHGLQIGQRQYPLQAFKSFSVMQEGAVPSIVFTPHKRFAPLTSAYYDPADEDRILAVLGDQLPLEVRKRDPIDRFLWRIRF